MIGALVGNYKVISQIGAGGMGEVYLAEHTTIGTRVAIKVLMAGISKDKEQVDRFFNEARAVNKVKHAGPVKIFDVGYYIDPNKPEQKHAYLVMEYLDGESLASRIKRLGSLPGDQVADIGRQIAGVLDAVHTAGITHRDLKPDNIFLIPDHELPSGERVKVLDFGIAKLTGTMSGGGPQTKGTMGTPAYMAPEQWNNAAAVDGRADTYSLGCVMFEMAVGKPPFPSQSIGEACNHHLNSRPPRASEIQRNVPPEFDNLVDRMLAKQSDQRPTIKEVSRAFDELRHSGATSRWTAAAVTGVAQTMAPDAHTPPPWSPAHGSQPNLDPGSHPHLTPPPGGGIHLGHTPGMQNPLSQSYPAQNPSQQYQAQSGSQPYIPQQGSQPYLPAPQHTTPIPAQGHFTPQHPTPPPGTYPPGTYPPQSGTYPPQPGGGSKKGLIIALVSVAVVGGGVAVAVTQMGGGDKKGGGSGEDPGSNGSNVAINNPKTPDAAVDNPPIDAAKPAPIDAPDKSLRERILANNKFVNRHGVTVLSNQITPKEWELVMGSKPPGAGKDPDDPVHSVMQVEAVEFCAKIGARLPTSDEWAQAAKGAWAIAVGPVAGPLQEWTSTIQDELAVVRGAYEDMPQAEKDRHARSKPPYFLQKDPGGPGADRTKVASPNISFRCVDAPPKTGAVDPTPKPDKVDATADTKGSITDVFRPATVAGPERFNRSFIRSIDKATGAVKFHETVVLKLNVSGTSVTGTSSESVLLDGRKYSAAYSLSGTITGDKVELTTRITSGDKLPGGNTWCAMTGKLTISADAKRSGHFILKGSMALVGPNCTGASEYYAFQSV